MLERGRAASTRSDRAGDVEPAERVFAVGLALWPVRRAGNIPRPDGRPVDTIPGHLQRADLNELYGLIPTKSRGWRGPANLICTCPAYDGEHAPGCALALWDDG